VSADSIPLRLAAARGLRGGLGSEDFASRLTVPQTACFWEATARKVGNVHPGAAFSDLNYDQFILSAKAIGPAFQKATSLKSVGALIRESVQDTRKVVETNTNLGIMILLAPLAMASPSSDLRSATERNLNDLTVSDADMVYRAIRVANPGGLGAAPEQDVREEPIVTLLEAMKLAADRDLVARQYANGFADIFDFGVPELLEGWEMFGSIEAAVVHSQLRWLETYPDSLIARKNGPAAAEDVRQRAGEVMRLGGIATPGGRRAGVELDRHLRSDGNKLNPGTTADLIAAGLFVVLREGKVKPSDPFEWATDEWL